MNKKEQNKSTHNTKSAILQSALELFALNGYDATSTRAIAQKSGANLSAISYHFGSKEGLYKAVFAHCFGFVEAILESAPNTPLEKIAHYATKMGELHQKQPFIARFFVAMITNPKPFLRDIFTQNQSKILAFLSDTFKQGIENGDFKSDLNTQSAMIAFISIVNFYFFVAQFEAIPQGFDNLKSTYAKNALDIFLNGIKAK